MNLSLKGAVLRLGFSGLLIGTVEVACSSGDSHSPALGSAAGFGGIVGDAAGSGAVGGSGHGAGNGGPAAASGGASSSSGGSAELAGASDAGDGSGAMNAGGVSAQSGATGASGTGGTAASGLGGSHAGGGLAGIGGVTGGSGGNGASGGTSGANESNGASGAVGASGAAAGGHSGGAAGASGTGGGTAGNATGGSAGSGHVPCGGSCPTGYACGTANSLEVCRATNSGIPLFTSVFVVVMENTSLGTLQSAMSGTGAPQLATLKSKYATGAAYHGVAHPSVPNYLALTSGDTQGASCDCSAAGQSACSAATCNSLLANCSCGVAVTNIADQLEAAQLSWQAYGEDMATPCSLTASGNYTPKHIPFLYYDDVRGSASRCSSRVINLSSLDANHPPRFSFIVPNLVHDMDSPTPAGAQNILNGDAWIGPMVSTITGSSGYEQGGLLVVVWDEDDASGGVSGSDDPVPIFVLSPFAKSGGYVSALKADHYSLLATVEDGLALPRLGNAGVPRAGMADTLTDYFPSN